MSVMRTGPVFLSLAASVLAADLPVKRVTVYSSGVACYERSGAVDGDVTIEMPFKTEQINDLLKSMVLMDPGGRVEPVVYASQDPIEKALRAFGIDLTQRPPLRALFEQLRGVPIELKLHTQAEPVKGKILGTEVHRVVDKNGQAMDLEYVNLACEEGIRSFALGDLRSTHLLDEKLDAELSQALGVLATSRDVSKKSVMLHFAGQGSRRVTAAYILEAPVWKTSYRLVLGKDEKPLLQGWAMVDNTTDEDWKDVQLTLVSGRPISFVQDLYTPLYVPRPEVKPEIYASLRPQKYEGDMFAEAAEKRPPEAPPPAPEAKAKLAMRGRAGGAKGEAAQEGIAYALQAAPAAVAGEAITATAAGVASMAQAAEAGELFKYAIQAPVTIARQKAAMLPIVNEAVEIEKLSIYNQSVQAKYPLNGVHLTNSTKLNLMQGPVTVFDESIYAGDAQLDNMNPAEKRLISYAVDLEREVVVDAQSAPQQTVSMWIKKGTLYLKNKFEQTRLYRIKNKGDANRTMLVEHPYQADWTLVEPKEPFERTAALYRFKFEAKAGKTDTLTVREERVTDQAVVIRSSGLDTIQLYLRSKVISKKVQEALQKVVTMRTALEQQEREVDRLKTKLRSIQDEQERLRANLGAVQQDSDLYRRYITKLEKQETEIEQHQGALAEAEAKVEKLRRELDDYLLNLDVE
ncbi:MAG: DUF4139 domain-containing protein [Planctomycetota bacterium]